MSSEALVINAEITLPSADLVWTAVRASGPGGQNVNKVSSKVALRFNLAGTTALPEAVKARMQRLCASRLDAEGWLMIASQKTRDQSRNLEDCRARLKALVLRALEAPKPRKPTRPSLGAKLRRLDAKKQTSARKAARQTPRGEE